MTLQKVAVLSITVAILLSIAACDAGPNIETESQALAYIEDYLKGKSWEGQNCWKVVREGNDTGWWVAYPYTDVNGSGWTVRGHWREKGSYGPSKNVRWKILFRSDVRALSKLAPRVSSHHLFPSC